MASRTPRVSILIPNYNHARFLAESIQSALDQTWPDKEVVVLDNGSTDDSLEVAERYRKHGVRVCRNSVNVWNRSFAALAERMSNGEFLLLLGADDALNPVFVEKAVQIMTQHPSVGYVHGERDFVDEKGALVELEPFFNCSFVAPGESVMPLYMVTTIAHPAQGLVRRTAYERIGGYGREIDYMNADRSLWFYLSSVSDYGYIREKMCRIRIGGATETTNNQKDLGHPIFCHLTINDFARFAEQYGYSEVVARRTEGLKKLARESLAWAGGVLARGEYGVAESYLEYARVMDRDIVDDPIWQTLKRMHDSRSPDEGWIRANNLEHSVRRRNYEPPAGFRRIETL